MSHHSTKCGGSTPNNDGSECGLVVASIQALERLRTEHRKGCCEAKVRSLGCATFLLVKDSTATVDGITVVRTRSGIGRWLRTDAATPSWAYQDDWYVNALTGNDENVGSAASPLKTFGEFARRNARQTLHPASGFTRVNVLTDLPDSDPITYDVTIATGNSFTVVGARTVLVSGTFTAVTPANPTTNVEQSVTDATLASFVPYLHKRITVTSGVAIGAFAWLDQLSGVPLNAADITDWAVQADPNDGFAEPPPAPPAPGDTYVIEELPLVSDGPKTIRGHILAPARAALPPPPPPFAFSSRVQTIDLKFRGTFSNVTIDGAAAFYGGATGCIFANTVFAHGQQYENTYFNCLFEGGYDNQSGYGALIFGGALGLDLLTVLAFRANLRVLSGVVQLEYFRLRNTLARFGGKVIIGQLSIFDTPGPIFAGAYVLENAIDTVNYDVTFAPSQFFGETGYVPLWGNGNDLPISMPAGSTIEISQLDAIAVPTVTNLDTPANPIAFAFSDTVPISGNAWQKSSGTWGPPVAFTWVGLLSVFPVGFQTEGPAIVGGRTVSGSNGGNPGFGNRVVYNLSLP